MEATGEETEQELYGDEKRHFGALRMGLRAMSGAATHTR